MIFIFLFLIFIFICFISVYFYYLLKQRDEEIEELFNLYYDHIQEDNIKNKGKVINLC